MLPLEGIRVVDLSRLAPGPFCSMLLGDFGADVILVEEPAHTGGRQTATEAAADEERAQRAAAYNFFGRNKRSVTINLKLEDGRRVFYDLARTADVVLEGFRPGVVKRLGVDYETLRAINPRLVYCSLSGYGQDGPYAGLVGHDINYISIGGALGMIGWPGTPPAIPMNLVADFAGGGLYAAFAILVALMARERTGQGQYVDMAMSDGVLSLLTFFISQYERSGEVPRGGTHLLNGGAPFYNVYETKDGKWISVGSIEPYFWENLCRALGREDFIPHQHATGEKREEIFAAFREQFKTKTRDEWFRILTETDICAAPVYSLDEALADPHNRHRGMVVEVEHPTLGAVRQVGVAPKLSATPGRVRRTAPVRGADTDAVLAELGYGPEQVAQLREAGVL